MRADFDKNHITTYNLIYHYMNSIDMQQTINQEMQGECFAKFIRFGEIFTLVTYHMSKSYTRVEGLKIKNQYGMKENGMGYEGVVPRSLFNGGSMVV